MNAFHPFRMNRRLRVARGIVLGTLGVIVLGFFRAQILEHGRYELKSRTNRLKAITLPAPRGVITDRRGAVLAENVRLTSPRSCSPTRHSALCPHWRSGASSSRDS
jgi:cell division protein FtsI/penicillin-binding protein 2